MLTRSERKKLIQQGIQCEFLKYVPKPVAKIRIKNNSYNDLSKSHRSPLVACCDNDKKQTNNVGTIVKIKDVEDCVYKRQYISMVDTESIETGYSSAPESTAEIDEVKPILNYTQPVMPATVLSKWEAQKKIQNIETSAETNRVSQAAIAKVHLSEKSLPILAVRPTVINAPTSKESGLNLEKQEPSDSILHTETVVNVSNRESLTEESKVNDGWVTNFQTIQPIQSKSKVKVLEILYLPPGTIDPFCPIDIYDQPLDLRINRPITNYSAGESLDLSFKSKNQEIKSKSSCSKPIDVLVASPQESYVEDEVLVLDASYASFMSSDTVSEHTEDCGSPLVCTQDIEQKFIFHAEQELHHNSDLSDISVFSQHKDVRRRVYEILNYPCLRYFEYNICTRSQCNFKHKLVEADDLQAILKSEPIIIVERCYALVHQFDSLFQKYFQIFCIIFGQNQMTDFLIGMISHCEWPKRPVSFYRHIIQGLQLCKLDEITCFTHLIQNSTVKSPKSFNILIWIMVDLGVVLDFRNKLREYLRHDGFYISAPNLTRLLGVCSRTKNCELIGIIHEAIENYPAKFKEQLHWGVRPKYMRLESCVLTSTKGERD